MSKQDEIRFNKIENTDSYITYKEKAKLFLFPQGIEVIFRKNLDT